jgi:hypothetical protein
VKGSDARALEAGATDHNGLRRFFERERRRSARRVGLPLALLSSGSLRYFVRRGLATFARAPVRTALYAAEVIVFADFLELGLFGVFLAIRSAVAAFGAFHWGALEPLRRAVRAAIARGDAPAAEHVTARYLRFAIDLAILELAVLVGWLEFGPRPFGAFSIFDAFVIGCGVRAMTETVTRTYHAGAFALRRVRRPFATLFAVDLADAGVPLLLWPWLGPWGFALGQLAGAAVEAGLTLHYTRRTYRDLPVSAPTLRRVLSDKRAEGTLGLLRGSIAPGAGNLVSQVDALLIAALAFGNSPQGLALAAGFHVLRPVLAVSGGWARVFYFDLAQLAGSVQQFFRRRFERMLFRAAPWFALAATLSAVGVVAAFAWSAPLPDWLGLAPLAWFVPFLLARSFYAVAQVRAFVNGAYAALGAGAVVVVIALLLIVQTGAGGGAALAVAALALCVASLAFRIRSGAGARPRELDETARLVEPFTFLARVRAHEDPLEILLLTLNRRAGARAARVARAISEVRSVDFAARWGRRQILLASSGKKALAPRIVEAAGGSLQAVEEMPRRARGVEALRELIASGLLDDEVDERVQTKAQLVAHFRAGFPGGTILDERSGKLPRRVATPLELARTLGEVAALAGGIRPARRRGVRSAVYAPGGEAELVFLAGRDVEAGAFAAFERAVFRASIAASLRDPSAARQ